MVTTVVSWNVAKRRKPWRELVRMDADVALLQEAGRVPPDVAHKIEAGPVEHWDSRLWNGDWCSDRYMADRWPMVVSLSDRVRVEWFKQVGPIKNAKCDEIAVSGIGTIAAARIVPQDAEPFIAVSMYARWIRPHRSTNTKWRVGFPDGSAHRIISDLSAFIGSHDPSTHRILAAGDLNMVFYDDDDGEALRASTVTHRMDALGLELLGPHHPGMGRGGVPTYYTTAQSPATAKTQLDWVFASRGFHRRVTVRALNSVEEWGPSDHSRLLIQVAE